MTPTRRSTPPTCTLLLALALLGSCADAAETGGGQMETANPAAGTTNRTTLPATVAHAPVPTTAVPAAQPTEAPGRSAPTTPRVTAPAPAATGTAPPAATPTATTTAAPPAATTAPGVHGPVVATRVGSFDSPMALVPLPGTDMLLLAERAGRVLPLEVAGDGSLLAGAPILDISDRVATDIEGGLLGLAVPTDGTTLYASLTDTDWWSRIEAFPLGGEGTITSGPRPLLGLEQPYRNHNGGHILADPAGRLLIGFGDGGLGGDPHGHGRDPSTLLGTILRIDPEPDGGSPYAVPRDNPFADPAGSRHADARPEVLAFGLRNPWRFDLDPATGDLWIADVGQDRIEEVNRLAAGDLASGADFGWAAMEGSTMFGPGPPPDEHVLPVHEYEQANSRCSITGGVVVRGGPLAASAGLDGAFLFSDLCDGRIRSVQPDGEGGWRAVDLGGEVDLPVSFGRALDGTVYVLSLSGGVHRLDPSG